MSPNEDNKLGMPNMNALCSRKCWDCIKMMRLDGQVCMIPVPPAAHPEKQTIEPVKWNPTPHGHSNSIIRITVRSWVKVGGVDKNWAVWELYVMGCIYSFIILCWPPKTP